VKKVEATCKKAGYVIYSIDLAKYYAEEETEESFVVEFKVELERTDHNYGENPQAYTWQETDEEGTWNVVAYLCVNEDCKLMVVQSRTLVVVEEAPEVEAPETNE